MYLKIKEVRKWARYFLKAKEAWGIIANSQGWKLSVQLHVPVDSNNQPIPWYTYPAIEFLRTLDFSNCKVFEYGSGNSSFFWAERSASVTTVEGDASWATMVRDKNLPRLTVITALDKEKYVNAPLTVGGSFDIVVIDGRHRHACVPIALSVIDPKGMILFDNADWYPDACGELRANGWFQIDFSGLGPINSYAWTTAVFMKGYDKFSRSVGALPVGHLSDGVSV